MERKVCLITGSTRGIGYSIAETLAERGFDLVLNYLAKEENHDEAMAALEAKGAKVIAIQGNVTIEEDVTEMFAQATEAFGRVDVVVNNAGITMDGLMMRMTLDQFKTVVDVNLNSCFLVSKAAIKHFGKKGGKIINMSSIVGVHGNAGQANYSASKAGMIGLSKTIAREYASRNVTCNCIAPGFIKTAMTDKLSDKVIDEMLKGVPLKRMGEVEDIANMTYFLASDMSDYITGQVFLVDGGMGI